MACVIGFVGYARSGKNQAALALAAHNFTERAFASELKNELCRTLGIARETLEQDKATYRPLLVEWGKARRRLDKSYWLKKVAADLPVGDFCVTDVRYLNEAKWILGLGGFLFRIIRPGVEAANDEERTTICEIDGALRHQMKYIDNNGSVDDLHKKVEAAWRSL